MECEFGTKLFTKAYPNGHTLSDWGVFFIPSYVIAQNISLRAELIFCYSAIHLGHKKSFIRRGS